MNNKREESFLEIELPEKQKVALTKYTRPSVIGRSGVRVLTTRPNVSGHYLHLKFTKEPILAFFISSCIQKVRSYQMNTYEYVRNIETGSDIEIITSYFSQSFTNTFDENSTI